MPPSQKQSEPKYIMMHLKGLEKQEQFKPKACTSEEIITIRTEINEIEIKGGQPKEHMQIKKWNVPHKWKQ